MSPRPHPNAHNVPKPMANAHARRTEKLCWLLTATGIPQCKYVCKRTWIQTRTVRGIVSRGGGEPEECKPDDDGSAGDALACSPAPLSRNLSVPP